MQDPTLRDLVLKVLAETDLTDPVALANEVATLTPPDKMDEFYRLALAGFVRTVNNDVRRSNVIINPTRYMPSAKVTAIREAHERSLRDRVFMGADSKMLGDCTYDDLMNAAKFRKELADRNLILAKRYEELAARLLSENVVRVADLAEYRDEDEDE
jgi:hypothetical protein